MLAFSTLLGCTRGEIPARAAWIQQQLVLENQVWIDREPDLVIQKFEKMGQDPYDFMRGTTGLFYANIGRNDIERSSTKFLTEEAAGWVMVVGDPHPENFGTLPSLEHSLEVPWGWTDLDAATYGPYLLDLRRLVLGTLMLARPLQGCENACLSATAEQVALGYVREIELLWSGAFTSLFSRILDDVEKEAREEGKERKRFHKYTEQFGDADVRLSRFEATEPLEKSHIELTAEQQIQLDTLIDDLNSQIESPVRLIDAVRRLGMGVNSFPATRYIVLVDSGQPGPDDDRLLGIREMRNPANVPTPNIGHPGWKDNGDRLQFMADHLWPTDNGDDMFRGVRQGAMSFRTRSYLSWSQEIDHKKVAEAWASGNIDADDVAETANMLGRGLAQAHAGGKTARGGSALRAIARDIANGGGQAFVRERLRQAAEDLEQLEMDHYTFQWLLDTQGALIGAETTTENIQ